jgi:hypothetical protein
MSEEKSKYRVKRKRESWPIMIEGKIHSFGTVAEAVAWAQDNCQPGEYTLFRMCPKKLVVKESTKKVASFESSAAKTSLFGPPTDHVRQVALGESPTVSESEG